MTTRTVQNRKTCMKNDIDGLPLRCRITKVHAAQQYNPRGGSTRSKAKAIVIATHETLILIRKTSLAGGNPVSQTPSAAVASGSSNKL
ncbi:unnamed protein product [Ceratitis capitata]|uniref:(Mediterranean fruit fly) hypothetical protein n=1 Tax=Ceratitis capitata TaxID=7213 RepID=A0A811VJM7_CERCA|nr:unnamed protein product [Ceratitis capitata]